MDSLEAASWKIAMLEKKEALVEKQIAEQVANANKWEEAGQKAKAMECMERKKSLECQLAKYASMRQNLQRQKASLADAALNADIFEEMKKNSESLKQAFGGLDEDRFEETLDGTNQTPLEICEALARPMGGANVDEDDIEDELCALMEDGAEEVAAPSAPQRVPAAAVADDDKAELWELMKSFGTEEKKAETPMDRMKALEQEIEMLKKEEALVEKQIAEEVAEARKWEEAGQKAKPLECMKRKESLEDELAKYVSTFHVGLWQREES